MPSVSEGVTNHLIILISQRNSLNVARAKPFAFYKTTFFPQPLKTLNDRK